MTDRCHPQMMPIFLTPDCHFLLLRRPTSVLPPISSSSLLPLLHLLLLLFQFLVLQLCCTTKIVIPLSNSILFYLCSFLLFLLFFISFIFSFFRYPLPCLPLPLAYVHFSSCRSIINLLLFKSPGACLCVQEEIYFYPCKFFNILSLVKGG